MSRVAVLQSAYIPWKGYFDIVDDVELFVFYDDVQYTKSDWRNRNRVKTAHGPVWLTVPCGRPRGRLICDVKIAASGWQRKHWETIRQAYSKAPGFGQVSAFLEDFYCSRRWSSLSDMNSSFITNVARLFLGIDTAFLQSRDYELCGAKEDRLLLLLERVGATSYLSGPSARAYLNEARFRRRGISLLWKSYEGYKKYTQMYPPFDHFVSVIDLLCSAGSASRQYLKAQPVPLSAGA